MSGVGEYGAGTVFNVRIYKRLNTRPDLTWANTYEIQAVSPQTTVLEGVEALTTAAEALAGYEQAFHLSSVEFDRAVVSTAAEDSQPYDPQAFLTVPLNLANGLVVVGTGQPLPLGVCLLARCQTLYGRAGRRLYRGCLMEGDVNAAAGRFVIEAAKESTLINLLSITRTNGLNSELVPAGFKLIMYDKKLPGVSRDILQVQPAGVVLKKTDNRYFDRA